MGWWGKIIGGTFGFIAMGPLGGLLGAAIGHSFDKGLNGLDSLADAAPWGGENQEQIQAAFFTATFSVMGHIAKADGRVSESEIEQARLTMARMQLDEEQKKVAIELFQQGKDGDFDLDGCLEQLRKMCGRRVNLLRMFMEIQLGTALADEELHVNEQTLLLHVAEALGFQRRQFEELLAMAVAQRRFAHHGGATSAGSSKADSLKEAYSVLGLNPEVTDAELKKAYRKLMSQHHPDKLVSKGLPEEMMKVATEKTREIKEAYDLIRRHRKSTS